MTTSVRPNSARVMSVSTDDIPIEFVEFVGKYGNIVFQMYLDKKTAKKLALEILLEIAIKEE